MTREPVTDETGSIELPPGWAYATIQELAGPAGMVTDGDWVESKDQDPSGTVRLIQLADIGDGFFVNKSNRFMNVRTAERLNCTFLAPGDVLIARMPNPLGRACIFSGVKGLAVTIVDVLVWRADARLSGADPKWLMHAINSPLIRKSIASQSSGTTRQRISGKKLKQLLLPTPPVEEQRRIVGKIETMFNGLDRALSALDYLPKLLDEYRALILELGCSGELTAKWRRDNNAETGRHTSVREVAERLDYGTSAKSQADGAVPVLRMGNIQDGLLDWSDLVYTSDKQEISKYSLEDGDVLFNRTNSPDLVGKSAVYRGSRSAIFAGYIIRIRCTGDVIPEYLNFCLNSPRGRKYARKVKSDGVSQSNINATKLAAFDFFLPCIEEQRVAVAQIKASLDWAKKVSAEWFSTVQLIYKLKEAILLKAMRGELAFQDSNEISAGDLLHKLKEMANHSVKLTTTRRTRKVKTPMSPIDRLVEDLRTWPDDGVTFSELYDRLALPYEDIRDAVFSCLAETQGLLSQTFDKQSAQMRLVRSSRT